jgi:uncharacterized protein
MYLNLRELELGKIRFDFDLPAGSLDDAEEQIRQPDFLHVSGEAELVEALGEIRLRGSLDGEIECVCGRCLDPFGFPVKESFRLVYEPAEAASRKPELALQERDADVGFYNGDGLELSDVIREQVYLALPMQRLCREDCRGICPVCGGNRNQEPCSCSAAQADERWSALRDYHPRK